MCILRIGRRCAVSGGRRGGGEEGATRSDAILPKRDRVQERSGEQGAWQTPQPDAVLEDPMGGKYFFHEEAALGSQIRPFGALEVHPLERSSIMVELFWVPEFRYTSKRIQLTALLAWGVRYRVTDAIMLESGVRVQGIEEANLIDAQIFGQFSFATMRIRKLIVAGR